MDLEILDLHAQHAERFAILVSSGAHGSSILEAAPPAR
jgi:hypothetical protein